MAQIGRSICYWLKKDSDQLSDDYWVDPELVEVICLSHDLGHPPFGHAGERSLNDFMRDFGGFEGNAQTLRLLSERIFSNKKGMNPTRAFLDGVLKYKTLRGELWKQDEANGKAPTNHFIYDQQEEHLNWVMSGVDFLKECTQGKEKNRFKSIECQIMDWADDTAYSLNDLSDSVRAGFLSIARVECWAEEERELCTKTSPLGALIDAIRNDQLESFVGRRIGCYIKSTQLKEVDNYNSNMSKKTNRYKYVLEVDEAKRRESKLFQKLARDVVFLSPELKQLEHKGGYMLEKLWETLKNCYIDDELLSGEDHQILPNQEAAEIKEISKDDKNARARLVCDFLAGLTDASAVRMYKRLFVPDFGSIGDWVG